MNTTGRHLLVGWQATIVSLAGFASSVSADVRLPNGNTVAEVDFERHVVSLFGRMGCNAGSCHGSFQGKGGFRLSLFGYSPGQDYQMVTRYGQARRINATLPGQSLLLLKPTLEIAHEGGRRFSPDSWQADVLREWIRRGARHHPSSGNIRSIRIDPPRHRFNGVDESTAITVNVAFTDGATLDMTPFCEIRVHDDMIVDADPHGRLQSLRPGATSVIVSYLGSIVTMRVVVPAASSNNVASAPLPDNLVDSHVFSKLQDLNIQPSRRCTDEVFLRRVTIDAIGCLPEPDEIREFIADPSPDKRTRLVDRLLVNRLHASLWATRFCDITGCDVASLGGNADVRARRAKMWHDWFRRRLEMNAGWDDIARGVLCATTRESRDVDDWIDHEVGLYRSAAAGFESDYAARRTLDLFWQKQGPNGEIPLNEISERLSAAFLGVRIECAQCHKHPFDRWTQEDYFGWTAAFSHVRFGSSPGLRSAMAARLKNRRQEIKLGESIPPLPRLKDVFLTAQQRKPKALGGPLLSTSDDSRRDVMDWLRAPTNPYFAPAFVNRVWAHYFGRGLVNPVDAFSIANPSSNPQLLAALSDEFMRTGFDIRHLERLILNSHSYQLSAIPNNSNATERTNFSRSYVRPLMAEVVIDVLNSALGVTEDFGRDVPEGSRAVEIAPNRLRSPRLSRVFRAFGRPERTAICDCERSNEPAVSQTLFLAADRIVLEHIRNGRLRRLLDSGHNDLRILEELFLATLSRFPDEAERQALDDRPNTPDREERFVDILWALINTREFITNH